MRKRLIALILLVTVPLLFGIAWFMSERSFTLSLEREKTRIQATQGVVFRDVQQTMQSLTYLEAVAYARQYTQYYHAQGIDLIFCWRGNPIADALLPNRYYDGLICGQRAAMLDTGSRPQRYAVAEPVNSNLTVILLGDVGDIYALKDTFRRMAFAVAGGASALLILLALILADVLTRPLRKLTEAARAMTTQSNTTVPLPTGQKDEIGTLARAFSEMQGAVEARETRLREESEARQALLEALAHEMRTPLTSLLGNARLLEQELPQEERKRIADSMAKEIHRLTDMDQQLMKLTAMGHEPPEAERVSVTELLRETARGRRGQRHYGRPGTALPAGGQPGRQCHPRLLHRDDGDPAGGAEWIYGAGPGHRHERRDPPPCLRALLEGRQGAHPPPGRSRSGAGAVPSDRGAARWLSDLLILTRTRNRRHLYNSVTYR